MRDEQKNKSQLIEELQDLRRRVEKLEDTISAFERITGVRPALAADRPERRDIHTHIEFIADFDIIEARGVNISKGGICFELEEDLPFEMRFEYEGDLHYYRANLVWLKRLPQGGYRFGLMFIRPEPFTPF